MLAAAFSIFITLMKKHYPPKGSNLISSLLVETTVLFIPTLLPCPFIFFQKIEKKKKKNG